MEEREKVVKSKWFYWEGFEKSPILKLFNQSVWFRVTTALVIAYIAIVIVYLIENWSRGEIICLPEDSAGICLLKELVGLIAVENIESFSILTAAILYLLESQQRQQKSIYEAWQVIDNAAAASVPTSPARFKALQDLNHNKVSLDGIYIPKVDLTNIKLANASLKGACIQEANLSRADLSNCNLNKANLEGANLGGVNLSKADLRCANLSKADLRGANLSKADLRGANLEEANLKGALLKESKLRCANLEKAKFWRANLSLASLKDAKLNGADLREANFQGANFENADLRQTSFKGAKLKEANFNSAQMSGANLRDAQLRDANLSGANLIRANLREADLFGANLEGADLRYVWKLNPNQIKTAQNYTEAQYDWKFQEKMNSEQSETVSEPIEGANKLLERFKSSNRVQDPPQDFED